MRIVSFAGAAVAGLGIVLTTDSSGATNANPPARLQVPVQRAQQSLAPRSARRRPAYAVSPFGCLSDSGEYFVGIGGAGSTNYAGGVDSAVLGGEDLESCADWSAIGAGGYNTISGATGGLGAENSFLAGGVDNAVTGGDAFLGSGYYNESSGISSFVGAGEYNLAEGNGSFQGAGGAEYAVYNSTAGGDNVADGVDSFVGAGDLNQISSAGNGSFIGGGGYAFASTRAATPNNQISGEDSFIGAGDNNNVAGSYAVVAGGSNNTIGSAADNSAIVSGAANSTSGGFYNFIGAGFGNHATAQGAFVGAGGGNTAGGLNAFVGAGNSNMATGSGSFVGGGGNASGGSTVSGEDSFDGAGDNNSVGGNQSVIAGGIANSIASSATYAAVGGGKYNSATSSASTVGGGAYNSATGTHATVPGGYDNQAEAQDSFAAGYDAKARNAGAFVWSDDASTSPLQSTANDQFTARASGGYILYSDTTGDAAVLPAGSGTWGSLSDRARKSNIVPLDSAAVLEKVAALPVSEWSYTAERGVRHVGPMAQDFYAAFGVGEDNRHITSIDEDGVALAAIKALHSENEALRHDSLTLHAENAALLQRLAQDEALHARVEARLAALERIVEKPAGARGVP
jgi:hypothetical protein